MIFGADSQNKNLKDAAAKRIDTSPRTETSNKYAATIASSKNTSVGADESGPKSVGHSRNPKRSDPIKGSFEGYMHGAATHIQMNNSGYLNKAMQNARYNKASVNHNGAANTLSFTKSNKSSIMNNNARVGESNSSSERIKEINKRNNLL
jgi:hypothetical protein